MLFIFEALLLAAALVLIAYFTERHLRNRSGGTERILSTRKIVVIGLFSALSAVLMVLDIPMPFTPPFYKLDFSELPALIGAFAFGPVAGVMIEFIKIVLKLIIKGTSTAFVGELANFLVGVSFILPASLIYLIKKSRKTAVIASLTGTIIMTVFGTVLNAVYLLPTFARLYGMPLDALIAMGTDVNSHIVNITTFVIFAVAPLNIIKGLSVSIITMLVYKRLSPIIKER